MPYTSDIHHRRSIRLRENDYSSSGAYFVTICTYQRECLFGDVVNGEMRMSEAGKIVAAVWEGLAERFPVVVFGDFVVMPNHFHGLLVIADAGRGVACRAPNPNRQAEKWGAASGAPTLGVVVRGFKSISAISINRLLCRQGMPLWQRNYYEHVIRGDEDLASVRRYIVENPLKWDVDENHRPS